MNNAERWAYARQVMSNASEHYSLIPHREIKPEWIEKIIAEPYHQETDPRDGRELYFGWINEVNHWVRVVVEDDQLVTAYIDGRLDKRFGRLQ